MTFRNHDPIIYLIGKISSINIQKKKKKKPQKTKKLTLIKTCALSKGTYS